MVSREAAHRPRLSGRRREDLDASIGLRKSTASGGLEDGSQRMWFFHTLTLLTELSHGNPNRPREALPRVPTFVGLTAGFTFGFKWNTFSGSYVVLSCAGRS
jgi:hypothetical protein